MCGSCFAETWNQLCLAGAALVRAGWIGPLALQLDMHEWVIFDRRGLKTPPSARAAATIFTVEKTCGLVMPAQNYEFSSHFSPPSPGSLQCLRPRGSLSYEYLCPLPFI